MPRRGLREIRTHAGAVGAATQAKTRHAVCLKMAHLELHRERLRDEKLAAELRMRDIDACSREIEVEINRLQSLLLRQPGGPGAAAGAGGATRRAGPVRAIRY
jgi:hypothetical protein